MKLREILTEKVAVIAPRASFYEAARKMRGLDIGALPVCDGERLVGMLTDRDLAVRAVAEGRDPRTALVRDSMTAEVAWCFNDESAGEAELMMAGKQIRRLPVLNRAQQLVGI